VAAASPPDHQFAGTPAAELFRRQQSRDPHARRARQLRITLQRAAAANATENDDRSLQAHQLPNDLSKKKKKKIWIIFIFYF